MSYDGPAIDLSIVLVTWNRKSLLQDCLRSITAHTEHIRYEVVVVDNGSTDGTREMICDEFPQVVLILNEKNLGFTRANNQGFQKSRGRYVVALNSDTLLRENTFERLVAFMDSHPEIGAIGPRLLYADGSIQESALKSFINIRSALFGGVHVARFVRRFLSSAYFVPEMAIPLHEQDRPLEVAWITGACLMVRRQVLEQVGGFDEKLFIYAEDIEWCYRIKSAGWAVYFYPCSSIVHLDHLPTKHSMKNVTSQHMANQVYFYRKHKGIFPALGLKTALFTGSVMKLGGFSILYALSYLSKRKAAPYLDFKVRFHLHSVRYFLRHPFSTDPYMPQK